MDQFYFVLWTVACANVLFNVDKVEKLNVNKHLFCAEKGKIYNIFWFLQWKS